MDGRKLPMMGRGTARNMYSFWTKINLEKLVRLLVLLKRKYLFSWDLVFLGLQVLAGIWRSVWVSGSQNIERKAAKNSYKGTVLYATRLGYPNIGSIQNNNIGNIV
jgi:hypothetical protein